MTFAIDTAIEVADRAWEGILPVVTDYVAIPAVSPAYDAGWAERGEIERAVMLVLDWCKAQTLPGLHVGVSRIEGRTPVVWCEIPASPGVTSTETVLLYGHLDKQPEMEGWRPGLGPWTPVLEGDRLFGRGGADDGYAVFAALSAIAAVDDAGGRHPRCVVLIEASEESGSPDLPAHVEALRGLLGDVTLVVCLDSGAADYDRLWLTTSLRGLAGGVLSVRVVDEGLHSGAYGGVVADTVRVTRMLLARIEDTATGRVLVPEAFAEVPAGLRAEVEASAAIVGTALIDEVPWAAGTRPVTPDPLEALLAAHWRPQLTVTGQDGLPATAAAANVLRPQTDLALSVRLSPTADPAAALAGLERMLTADPPYGATVTFAGGSAAAGWCAPAFDPWLREALDAASQRTFGLPAMTRGEGGTIPFMAMLGELFPAAQFVVTGVLGPHSNAHGPNEFLDLPTARRVTACVAAVLDAATRRG